MKTTKHPQMKEVLFKDMVTGDLFLINSTAETTEKMVWTDGKEYPLMKIEVSSKSHPAYQESGKFEKPQSSRAEQFKKRFNK